MANVPFSTLYDQVLPYLPSAEPAIVDSQIRKVLREFMKRTTIIRQTFAFSSVAPIDVYQLVPTFGQVSSVLRVYIGTAPDLVQLPVVPEESLRPAEDAKPRGWYTMLPHLLTLYPRPDATYDITVEAVVTLKQDDVDFPEELYLQYGEAIACGVLALMYSMPGKPWTQAQAAKESGRLYSGMIKTIRATLRDGGQPNQSTFQGIARFGA